MRAAELAALSRAEAVLRLRGLLAAGARLAATYRSPGAKRPGFTTFAAVLPDGRAEDVSAVAAAATGTTSPYVLGIPAGRDLAVGLLTRALGRTEL